MKYLFFAILIYTVPLHGQPGLADSIIRKTSIDSTLLFLSGDSLKGRLAGAEGANKAARFIADQFTAIGLKKASGSNEYFDPFVLTNIRKKRIALNVMGAIEGKFTNDTMVIFSAHYDHVGQGNDLDTHKPYSSLDNIFNGANDNATGVTALIELAKYYKAQDSNRYLLLFVAFSGEEMGMQGSEYLMQKTNPRVVKAVVNLEMLGRPNDQSCFIVSFRNSAIKRLLNDYLQRQDPTATNFFTTDPYNDENLAYRSDHYPFARKIKNAFTIMGTSPLDEYYHSVDDEYPTIDLDFLTNATKRIALACEVFTR